MARALNAYQIVTSVQRLPKLAQAFKAYLIGIFFKKIFKNQFKIFLKNQFSTLTPIPWDFEDKIFSKFFLPPHSAPQPPWGLALKNDFFS